MKTRGFSLALLIIAFALLASSVEAQEVVWELFGMEAAAPDDAKRKLFPLKTMDIAGFAISGFLIMIAAGGGIGGGGVLVPTYIFILGFPPHLAIPLSNATILGSSLANCLLNAKKRHPAANRPLIDWDIMLVMEPVTIAGSVVGTYVNALMPPWLLCVLLVLLLGLTTIKTSIKGVQMYKKESLEREAASEAPNLAIYQTLPGTADEFNEKDEEAWVTHEPELERLLESESKHSLWKLGTIFTVTAGTALITVFKGGQGLNPFNVTCGSTQWWLISAAVLPFVLLISFLARRHLVRIYHLKERLDWEYLETDVLWSERNTIVYPLACSIAGLCAGLFGIGGGIVKGPLMLEMGVLPQVASATSATMILFTSFAATSCYILFGSLTMEYAMVLFPLGLLFTIAGQLLLNSIVKRYNRSSLIILCIATVIGLSTIAMGFESSGGLIDLVKGIPTPKRSICQSTSA